MRTPLWSCSNRLQRLLEETGSPLLRPGGLRLKIDPSRVLAPLPTGVLCTLCGRGGADIQLMHCSHIDFWHRTCAEQYFEGRCRSRRPLPTDRHAFRVAVTCFGLRESLKIRGRQHDSSAACESQ